MHCTRILKSACLNHLPGKRIFPYAVLIFCLLYTNSVLAQTTQVGNEKYGRVVIDSNDVVDAMKTSRDLHKTHPAGQDDITYAQSAVDLALQLGDTLLFARALDNMGLLHRYHKQYQQSLPLHIKAFDLIRNMPTDPLYKMIFANNAGVAARYMDKYDESVYYYLEALKIAERENNLKNIAISSNGLGNALGNIPNRREEAMAYFNRALKAEEQQNNSLGMAMNLLSISHYHIDQKQYHQAREVLAKLSAFNQKLEDDHGLAITD